MESLYKFEVVNLLAIIIKHMPKVMPVKIKKHEIPYDYLLNKLFNLLKDKCAN